MDISWNICITGQQIALFNIYGGWVLKKFGKYFVEKICADKRAKYTFINASHVCRDVPRLLPCQMFLT